METGVVDSFDQNSSSSSSSSSSSILSNLPLMEEEDMCIYDGPFNHSTNDTVWSCLLDDPSATISFENVVKVVVPTIFGVIAVLGLSGNLLVVIVVVSSRQMRNTTNVLIVNLALADLIFIVVCVPFTAIGYATPVWPFGNIWCKIYQYVIHVTVYASVYTLVLMSLDRYLAVVHPIHSLTLRTVRNASLVAGLAWVLILTLNYPVLVEHQAIEYRFYGQLRSACMNALIYQDENEDLADSHKSEDYRARIYYACFFAFAFVVPLAIVSVLYGLMVKRLLKGVIPGRSKNAESMKSKRRVTRLVVVVVVIFALCWLPLQMILVIQFVGNYTDHDSTFTVMKIASNCLAYMNSCVNPMLYAFLSDNFRKSFRHVIYSCCCFCRGRVESAESRGQLLNNDDRLTRSGSRNQLTRSIALNDLSTTTRIESKSCLLEIREAEIYGTCSRGNANLLAVPILHQ